MKAGVVCAGVLCVALATVCGADRACLLDASASCPVGEPGLCSSQPCSAWTLAPDVVSDDVALASCSNASALCLDDRCRSVACEQVLADDDWVNGGLGDSCETACAEFGLTCNAAGTSVLTSSELVELVFVSSLAPYGCDATGSAANVPGASASSLGCTFLQGVSAQCSFSNADVYPLCCCGTNCPIAAGAILQASQTIVKYRGQKS
mmetsp:Transcript_10538/g.28019  ORF Transcript_10538/g.28019 Transcript_10538/m.28019 type:complete len:207 (+) Transcript_10538:30-650(+)